MEEKAYANNTAVNTSFALAPWLKLRTTKSFFVAPENLNANTANTAFGNIAAKQPSATSTHIC